MTRSPASIWRRLGAMAYDTLVLGGALFVAGIPLVAIDPQTRESFPIESAIQLYLSGVIGAYFVVSWRRGGQTVGMRAWRLRLLDARGSTPSYRDLFVRLFAAIACLLPAGAGYWWVLFDPEREAVHDKVSKTFIYHEKP
ncbi:MAG: RDD family protein [Proteobacteria bacterium]|nr:MAG: RDD family protein [Pseudomonadota bacterium]